jgi:FAD/FMN-containing dehydrogenase
VGVSALARALGEVVGERHVLADPELRAGYEVDWTRRFRGEAALVVRPGDASEVVEVLRRCADAGAAVVPQGGNSGLVGGAVPLAPAAVGVNARAGGGERGTHAGSAPAGLGEVVLSLARLDAIEVDAGAARVDAGAGATLAALHDAAAPHGLAFGVDFAARELATVGGMIATNAGGPRVLRHGRMAAQVVGVEAALADGTVVRRMGAVERDATGYDLTRLLCGSEGTLAVVTRARLRLVARPARRVAVLVAFASIEDAVAAVAAWRLALPDLEAADVLFDNGLERVCAHRRLARPFEQAHPVYVLVEAAGGDAAGPTGAAAARGSRGDDPAGSPAADPADAPGADPAGSPGADPAGSPAADPAGSRGDDPAGSPAADPLPALAAAIDGTPGVRGTVVADDTAGRARLWTYREDVPEALGAAGVVHKLDVAVPPQRIPELAARAPELVERIEPRAEVFLIGHLAEGNLHVNVLGLDPGDERADAAILELVAELGGSIAAEHGIGQAKVRWLGLSRTPEDIAAMSAIKRALDPGWRLNPGKLLPRPAGA